MNKRHPPVKDLCRKKAQESQKFWIITVLSGNLVQVTTFLFLLFFLSGSVLSGQWKDSPESTEQYKYAMGLIQRQLYDEAINVLKRVIADASPFSKRDSALFWQGECHYRKNKFREAISFYEKMLSEFPDSPLFNRAAYGLGWAYARDNNPKSAVESFSQVEMTDIKLWTDARLKMGFLMVKYGMDTQTTAGVYRELLQKGKLTRDQLYDIYLQLGIQTFNLNNFGEAFQNFSQALDCAQDDQRPMIQFYLAESLFREKRYLEAEKYYQDIVTGSSPADLIDKSRYSMAWCRVKSGSPENAISLFKVLAENQAAINRKEAVRNLVDLLMNLHKYQEATDWMDRASRILTGEEATEMEYLRGLAFSRLGEFPDALLAFKNFLKAHPKDKRADDAHYQLGLIYISMGKFREALDCLESLVHRNVPPELREKALYRLGECYFNLGNMKNARSTFEKLLRDYPKGTARSDAIYQLGEIEYQIGNHSDAFNAFSAIGSGTGELAGQATFRAGEVLMKAARFVDAVAAFEDYLSRFPSGNLRDDAKFKLGLCYLEMKDQGKALAAFSQLQDSKGYFRQEARYQIGEIAQSLDNFPLAIQQYKAITAEDPKNPLASRARRAVGICLYKMKDFAGAEETFRSILKDYPMGDAAVPESRLWHGKALIALGRVDEGILEVLKVPILFPRSQFVPEAYANAARAYSGQGKDENAKKMWHELLQVQGKGPLAQEAREALKK